MAIHIEVRKIELAFGQDKWEIRFGDIAGSINMHNITKADVIKSFIREINTESNKKEAE